MGAIEVGVAGLVVEGEGCVPAGFCFSVKPETRSSAHAECGGGAVGGW